uniref:Uncharacterized protein n=1 Tax=Oryza meridionalis TaxID=40149 RepID=A0A0E0EA61_9ORYZ
MPLDEFGVVDLDFLQNHAKHAVQNHAPVEGQHRRKDMTEEVTKQFLDPRSSPPLASYVLPLASVERDDPAAGGGQEIVVVVLYRYTCYSRTCNGCKGVEMSRRTKLNRLWYVVSPVADLASSLA